MQIHILMGKQFPLQVKRAANIAALLFGIYRTPLPFYWHYFDNCY